MDLASNQTDVTILIRTVQLLLTLQANYTVAVIFVDDSDSDCPGVATDVDVVGISTVVSTEADHCSPKYCQTGAFEFP